MLHSIANKLTKIRTLMQQHDIDYYYVPARDAHNDEYAPACWQRRAYISGFDGSAGDVLIGLDSAYLWTDPRYFLQASQQLDDKYYTLMKQQQGTAPIHEWLAKNAAGKTVGSDPKVLNIVEQKRWHQALQEVDGKLIAIDDNLVDAIWDEQASLPQEPIIALASEFTGVDTKAKLSELRNSLKQHGAQAHALNLLDAIAWLFNIRGNDIAFNPLAISYALITEDDATFFIDAEKIDNDVAAYLAAQKINVQSYADFAAALNTYQGTLLLEPTTASWWMAQQLKKATIIYADSPIALMKSRKNPTEQRGMAEAHRRDGLALCKIFYWLENNWKNQTELSLSQRVTEFRAEDPHFRGPSFTTIDGYADHGAIIHYSVTEASDQPIGDQSLLLLDSGGQYFEGTTDVTRTVHLGIPNAKHKEHYTLVLKGHLALRHTIFPHGTCGEHLNALAHRPLWNHGLDFGHGTGHGVGCYLCVHEGPQRISSGATNVPLVAGMIVSNEPGFYINGEYGIRIENLVAIVEKFPESENGPAFYGFEDLTLFPYARNLIDKKMLNAEEIEWVDNYHQLVYNSLQKDLSDEMRAWLKEMVAPL